MSLEDFDNVWVSELIFAVGRETQEILDVTGDAAGSLGTPPETLVGLPLFMFVHRDDLQAAQDAFDRTVANGRATWEGRVQRADGTFVAYGWEGRLGLDGETIYARSRDLGLVRAAVADMRVYERLADLTADLLIVADDQGRIVQVNRSVAEAHNALEHDFTGTFLTDYVPAEGKRILNEIPMRVLNGEAVIDFRVPALDGLGGEMIMEGTATFDELTNRWYVVERNVTERVRREEELEITQRFFDLSASQLVLVDAEDCVVRANRSFLSLIGWELDEVVGADILDALRVVGGSNLRAKLALARVGGPADSLEVRVRVGGAPRTLEILPSAAEDGGSVYLSCRDVTEERSLRAELVRRASHDPLTGLANRPSLLDAIESDLASGAFVAVVALDLDGFKKINDSLGHAAGDALLVAIADRLDQQTRGVDIVARMGGDEFVILLRGVPDLATVGLVGDKIQRAFGHPFDVLGRPVDISASVGATGGHRSTHTREQLLLEADLSTYAAKQASDGTCRVFDEELRYRADFAGAVEEHLRRVINSSYFDLDVLEIRGVDGKTLGVGAIAPAVSISGDRRWNEASMLVAKNLGLLGAISARITNEAVRRLASWLSANPHATLEIVYDAAELSMKGFDTQLLGVLHDNAVDPHQFVVSLSGLDGLAAHSPEAAAVNALRRAGVRIALAESSVDARTLSVLASVGIDRIEVDAARLAAWADGSVNRLIADTVLDIADRLGVEVLVDAGFNPDVVDLPTVFRNCSPTSVEFSRPIPVEDFLAPSILESSAPGETDVD